MTRFRPDVSEFEAITNNQMQEIFNNCKTTNEFHNGDWIESDYYLRHIIECVLRIRMNNDLDNEAAQTEMIRNPMLAKDLTYYIYDELGHDDLFIADLEKMGVNRSDLAKHRPFNCTIALMGFLKEAVKLDGALPAVVWDWFLEYYGDKFNGKITEKATCLMGSAVTKGAKAHLMTDETEDHSGMMTTMLERAVKTKEDNIKAKEYLERCLEFVGEYFYELSTYANKTQPKVING